MGPVTWTCRLGQSQGGRPSPANLPPFRVACLSLALLCTCGDRPSPFYSQYPLPKAAGHCFSAAVRGVRRGARPSECCLETKPTPWAHF